MTQATRKYVARWTISRPRGDTSVYLDCKPQQQIPYSFGLQTTAAVDTSFPKLYGINKEEHAGIIGWKEELMRPHEELCVLV